MPGNDLINQLSQLREENQRLRQAVDELSILNELARVISSTMSLDVLMETIVKRSLRAVRAQQAAITLVDELAPAEKETLIRALNSTTEHERFHLDQNIIGWMMLYKQPLLSNNIAADERFSGVRVEREVQSILCVPLLVKNRMIGILTAYNKKEPEPFSEEDKRLLSIIATQSAQVLENARLYEQELQKMAMEREFIAAREVQVSLLPRRLPQLPHFEFAACALPAREIGGDYYDFIPLGDQRWEIVIADVAGKGLPAALLTVMGKGVLYAQALQHASPQMHIKESNRIVRRYLPRKYFITMLLALVDPDARTVTIANAGHCFPLLFRDSTKAAEFFPVKGMALNLADEISCDEHTAHLEPGDCIVLYSDGVDEAQNSAGDFFGVERLQSVVSAHAHGSAEMLLQKIVDEIKSFSKDVPQSDDITLVIVKAKG